MADHGSIGKVMNVEKPLMRYIPVAFYAASPDIPRPHIANNYGRISGVVVYSSTPVQYTSVWLLYDPTGERVATTKTDETGAFLFKDIHIGGASKTYTVVAFRETQNARVFTGVQAYNPYI